MINLTDLSMGKTEASPAFSRLQPYQSDLTSSNCMKLIQAKYLVMALILDLG